MSITGLIDKTFRPHKGAVYRHGLAMPEAEYETATGRRLFTVAQMEKIAAIGIDAGREECEREINMLLQTLERLQKGVDAAVIIIRDYANDNPKHKYQGREQDPRGAHAWLEEFVRSDPPRKLKTPNVELTGAARHERE